MTMTPTKPDLSIPTVECEWCGKPVKYVKELPRTLDTKNARTVPIDTEPLPADHWQGDLVRVPPAKAGGLIDCATDPANAEGWGYQRSYRKHKNTCEHADKWTGRKKWNRPRRPEARRTPETEHLTEEQRAELARTDTMLGW